MECLSKNHVTELTQTYKSIDNQFHSNIPASEKMKRKLGGVENFKHANHL